MRTSGLLGLALILCGCGAGEQPHTDTTPAPAPPTAAAPTPAPGTAEPAPPAASPQTPPPDAPAPEPAAANHGGIPLFNASCGDGIEVHADEGGPVFIDGQEASLKKFNDNYFEATRAGTTISITFQPDGSLGLSFSGPARANGICTLK